MLLSTHDISPFHGPQVWSLVGFTFYEADHGVEPLSQSGGE